LRHPTSLPQAAELGRDATRCDLWQPQQARESIMPRGDKSSYTDKQKRKAEHIEQGYEGRGVAPKEAERRAWATVNKDSGGGNKSGSGRGVADTITSAKRGARIGGPRGGKAAASRPAAAKSRSAKRPRPPESARPAPELGRARPRGRNRLWRRLLTPLRRPARRAGP
jgi:hypothetical protein